MKQIKVLGTGCLKCKQLLDNTTKAAENMDIGIEPEMVSNVNDIVAYGVMVTPALVIDDMVWASGNVPSVEEIEEIFRKNG